MPPIRTVSSSKPVKTERTHEENQERAYIAASRRSDRSLEARVESARRASEIHKRRTGRSLRVTEQDVVNEEMYEEEDDDLPMQYRRLTAHLQTGSADFNRRLAAYLTNHVAMRSALDQAMGNSYAQPQQYPNGAQFAHPAQLQQYPPAYPTPMMPPQMMQRSPPYRQAPYPVVNQGIRLPPHQRSPSVPNPQEQIQFSTAYSTQSPTDANFDSRRTPMPTRGNSPSAAYNGQPQPQPAPLSRTPSSTYLPKQALSPSYYQGHDPAQAQRMSKQNSLEAPVQWHNIVPSSQPQPMHPYANFTPFSTALPMESQQFLGPALNPNDPFTAMLMSGSDVVPQQPFYSYNPNPSSSKPRKYHPTSDGMSQTLAPAALDTSINGGNDVNYTSPQTVTTDGIATPFTPVFSYGYDAGFDGYKSSNLPNTQSSSTYNSRGVSPAIDKEWTNFIDCNNWDDGTNSA